MGRKDIAGKAYFSDGKRFAELMNEHLYHGNRILTAKNLIKREWGYPSLPGVYGEKERDILMEDVVQKIYYGMELETASDHSMPERIMVYDACEYERQIRAICRSHHERKEYKNFYEKKSRMIEEDYLLPTVTVVLYLGEGHWQGRTRLSELFGISEQNRKQLGMRLHEYDFLLIEADYVNAEIYQTDLRQFFQAMQCRKDRKKLRDLLRADDFAHLAPETELAIATHLQVRKLVNKMRREEMSMCKAFDDLMKEERRNGKIEGRREAEKKIRKKIIKKMYRKGMEETLIREITECTKKEFAAAVGR